LLSPSAVSDWRTQLPVATLRVAAGAKQPPEAEALIAAHFKGRVVWIRSDTQQNALLGEVAAD
jgi:hypothetical protein